MTAQRELSEETLDALMARLADGDRAAFDPLFRALHPRALRVAVARLEPTLAADAAQSALVAVFARASEFSPGLPVLPWFYAIVANEIRTLARRSAAARARTVAGDVAHHLEGANDPEREMIDRELRRALGVAIEMLDVQGAEAIGALLGVSERPAIGAAAFRKRLSRAYARLRLLLLGGSHGG